MSIISDVSETNLSWTLLQIIAWQTTGDKNLVKSLGTDQLGSLDLAIKIAELGVLAENPKDTAGRMAEGQFSAHWRSSEYVGGAAQEIIEAHKSGIICLLERVGADDLKHIDREALNNASVWHSYRQGFYIRTDPPPPSSGLGGAGFASSFQVKHTEWHDVRALVSEVLTAFPQPGK